MKISDGEEHSSQQWVMLKLTQRNTLGKNKNQSGLAGGHSVAKNGNLMRACATGMKRFCYAVNTLSQEKRVKTRCTKGIKRTIFVTFHIMLQCNANTIKQIGYV